MNRPTTADATPIRDVADTAFWVAHYRAVESERPDALFTDPLAPDLVGSRGPAIARRLGHRGTMTQFSVVMRTWIIDRLVRRLVDEGLDTVLNLGAGMDTRPYRLGLPSSLRWIEVDQEAVIAHKSRSLASETPTVDLRRIALDLLQRPQRQEVLARVAEESKSVLVLTEGLLPYFDEQQVGELADDLHATPKIDAWIAEYFAPSVYRYLRERKRARVMRNAPFRFFPDDWFGFFETRGWKPSEMRFVGEEARSVGRRAPLPRWLRMLRLFAGRRRRAAWDRTAAYVVYQRCDEG